MSWVKDTPSSSHGGNANLCPAKSNLEEPGRQMWYRKAIERFPRDLYATSCATHWWEFQHVHSNEKLFWCHSCTLSNLVHRFLCDDTFTHRSLWFFYHGHGDSDWLQGILNMLYIIIITFGEIKFQICMDPNANTVIQRILESGHGKKQVAPNPDHASCSGNQTAQWG